MKQHLTYFILLICSLQVSATHILGGELNWQCISSGPDAGKVKFTVIIYRDCAASQSYFAPTVTINSDSSVSNIQCTLVSVADINPTCYDSTAQISCGATTFGTGAMQMGIYESSPVSLIGTPPPTGWKFTMSTCCRYTYLTNLNSVQSYSMHAYMFPYTANGSIQSANQCYDNSPTFIDKPQTLASTGAPYSSIVMPYDSDHDSIYVDWANIPSASFTAGYSYNQPFPLSFNATLNQSNGLLTMTPNVNGVYGYNIEISSYRGGQLISKTYRECPIAISTPTTANANPILSVYPIGNYPMPQVNPMDSSTYILNVNKGDHIEFGIHGLDTNLNANGMPQDVTCAVNGAQMATNSNGCLPPCATVNPANGQTSLTSLISTQAIFSWDATCNHIQNNDPTSHLFYAKAYDDACAVNGSVTVPIIITVYPDSIGCPTNFNNSIMTPNQTIITWSPPADTGSSFQGYVISKSDSIHGPFIAMDTIHDYQTNQYTIDPIAEGSAYYYFNTLGTCAQSPNSDTLFIPSSVGIDEHTSQFSISPNPSNGRIRISMINRPGIVQISVTNTMGQRVYTDVLTEDFKDIDLSNLPNGVYIVSLHGNGIEQEERMVIHDAY